MCDAADGPTVADLDAAIPRGKSRDLQVIPTWVSRNAAGRASRSTETPAPEPASVARARRLVAAALAAADHGEDVVDVATLLVSEVVTNSVLHAGTEIGLRCERRGGGVRVEVSDGSSMVPGVRHYDPDATTGRGLGLVSTLATSWGVRLHDHGKTLRFEVGDVAGATSPSRTGRRPGSEHSTEPASMVHLLGASPALVRATIEQGDVAPRAGVARSRWRARRRAPAWMAPPQFDVGPILAAAEVATRAGRANAYLEFSLPAGSETAGLERMRLIDVADALARGDRRLSDPALPEIGAFRHWLYTQITEQARGFAAQPRELPEPLEPARVAAVLSPTELARIGRLDSARPRWSPTTRTASSS